MFNLSLPLSSLPQLTAGIPPELYDKGNRLSHSSDTSQTDTMTSVTSSSLDSDEVDLSGLVESVVDSDEEDIAESIDVSFFFALAVFKGVVNLVNCF